MLRQLAKSWSSPKNTPLTELLCCSVVEFSRDNIDNPVGYSKGLTEILGIPNHLIKHLPRFSIMRGRQAKLLNLGKLTDGIVRCHGNKMTTIFCGSITVARQNGTHLLIMNKVIEVIIN